MEPVFNQAPKAGHVYFVTDTYIKCIISNLYSLKNILAEDNIGVLFNTGVNIYIKIIKKQCNMRYTLGCIFVFKSPYL